MKTLNPDSRYGFVSLEGYLVGRFAAEILAHMDPAQISRDRFIEKIYDLKTITIDDVTLTFGAEDNQGMDKVFMTVLGADGQFTPVTTLEKGRRE